MSSPIGLLQEQIQRAEALMGLPNNAPQYENNQYAKAIEEAFKPVIQAEQRSYEQRTGKRPDGDTLINRAFGPANETPVTAFIPLQGPEDKDQHQDMMILFKGIIDIRNTK